MPLSLFSTLSATDLVFREVGPTDLPACAALEKASYPPDEAASKSALQYRQHLAARYFRCAVLPAGYAPNDGDNGQEDDEVVGFICATRCHDFNADSLTTHTSSGALLAIHSVVVSPIVRRRGIATAMLRDYIQHMEDLNANRLEHAVSPMDKMILMSKKHLLCFYVDAGFSVIRPSPIVHGEEQWYELEKRLPPNPFQRNYPCFVVDAFADVQKRGTGNPAAVVLCEEESADMEDTKCVQWMQTVAQEFNLAETAFVWPKKVVADDNGEVQEKKIKEAHFYIRYFTPTMEVALCGHATLASAAVLYQTLVADAASDTTIVFSAKEDVLKAQRAAPLSDKGKCRIAMEFPSKPATPLATKQDQKAVLGMLQAGFGLSAKHVLWTGLSDIGDVLIELTPESFDSVGYDNINHQALMEWNGYSRGVILSCRGDPVPSLDSNNDDSSKDGEVSIDFRSRFFAPKAGIVEDPVTGSAHCILAPYYGSLLEKTTLMGRQESSRGGLVHCELIGPSTTLTEEEKDDEEKTAVAAAAAPTHVRMTGMAVTTMEGRLQ